MIKFRDVIRITKNYLTLRLTKTLQNPFFKILITGIS